MKKINKTEELGRLKAICAICFAVAYALCCFALSPLYFSLDANVDFAESVLPVIVQYVGVVAEIAAISVFYAIMIYGIYSFGYKASRGCIGIYAAAAFCKYSANVAMTWVRYSSIPSGWGWDVANVAFYTALEMVQVWIVLAIVRRCIERGEGEMLPFSRIYAKGNSLMNGALVCGVATVAVKVLGRLADDIFTMIAYGLPEQWITVVLMLLSYLSNLLLGAVCYVIVVFVIGRLHAKNSGAVATEQ